MFGLFAPLPKVEKTAGIMCLHIIIIIIIIVCVMFIISIIHCLFFQLIIIRCSSTDDTQTQRVICLIHVQFIIGQIQTVTTANGQ